MSEVLAGYFLVLQVADFIGKKLTLGQIDPIELAMPLSSLSAFRSVTVVRRGAGTAKLFACPVFDRRPVEVLFPPLVRPAMVRQRGIFAATTVLTLE